MRFQLQRLSAWLTAKRWVKSLMLIIIQYTVPRQRIGAGVVLFDENDKVLLLKHAFHGEIPWGVPGGWIARREAPAQGALRELREETGLEATLGPAVFVDHLRRQPSLNIYYLGSQPRGTLRLSFEVVEADWFGIDELPADMLPKVRRAVEWAAQIQRGLRDNYLEMPVRVPRRQRERKRMKS